MSIGDPNWSHYGRSGANFQKLRNIETAMILSVFK